MEWPRSSRKDVTVRPDLKGIETYVFCVGHRITDVTVRPDLKGIETVGHRITDSVDTFAVTVRPDLKGIETGTVGS